MYQKGLQGWLKHWDFIMIDILCLQAAFIMSYGIRHGSYNPYVRQDYLGAAIMFIIVDLLVSILGSSFKNILKRGRYQEFTAVLKHVILVQLCATCYLFFAQTGSNYSRIMFFIMADLHIVFTYVARSVWKYRLCRSMPMMSRHSLLLVSTDEIVEEAVRNVKNAIGGNLYLTGAAVLDFERCGEQVEGIDIVAGGRNVTDYVRQNWVDEVLIVLPRHLPYPVDLVDNFRGMGVAVHTAITRAKDTPEYKQQIEKLGGYTVLTTCLNYATPLQLLVKKTMDFTGALAGCLITGVLFLVLAPVIYIKSPGPIFFAQERIGKNGRRFKMYKFRSMYPDAEERKKELMEQNRCKDGMMFKLDFDPRIIGARQMPDGTVKKGIGNFIRDWSLDEFPQFFNVLKGDMSLVGTRPPTPDEWDKYEAHHRARLAVKPGITGLWQVSGRSVITDFEDVVRLDTQYINEWSIGLDCKILFKTVRVVLMRKGAM